MESEWPNRALCSAAHMRAEKGGGKGGGCAADVRNCSPLPPPAACLPILLLLPAPACSPAQGKRGSSGACHRGKIPREEVFGEEEGGV